MKKHYTTLLFDADNTLLHFDKDEEEALKRVMADYNLPITEKNCNEYKKINDALWKRFEKGEITKMDIKATRFKIFLNFMGITEGFDPLEINETYLGYLTEGGNTIDGAAEICRFLKDKGYDLYIITNGIANTQARRLERSCLLPFFTKVFVSETIGFQKPMKEFFTHALNNIQEKDKEKILVIGDSLSSDIKGAENAGLDYIWYNHRKAEIPADLCAEAIIDNIRELQNIL